MKVTLAFLFLGICLALTNARSVDKKKMMQSEAYSYGRMMCFVMKRWNDLQNCHKCSDIERYCMEKAIVEDTCFILKVMTKDMGYSLEQFFRGKQLHIHITFIVNAVEKNEIETLTKMLKTHGKLNNFMEATCVSMNTLLKECNVDFVDILAKLNNILGGGLNRVLSLSGIVKSVGDLTNVATEVVGGVTNTATEVVAGVTSGLIGGFFGGQGGKKG